MTTPDKPEYGSAHRTAYQRKRDLAEIALWRTTLLCGQTAALRARAIAELRRLGVNAQPPNDE